ATWSVVEAGGGAVDAGGRYTAPLTPGTYHLRATAAGDPARTAEATVHVEVDGRWRTYLNLFRSLTRGADGSPLPAVSEDPALSQGAAAHARYLVANDTSHPDVDPSGNVHDEDPVATGFSKAGQLAARHGNVVRSEDAHMDDQRAFDAWMAGPFHALGILDPRLARVGYARWNQADGRGWQSAAVLDVLSGQDSAPAAGVTFPLFFPGPGAVTPLLAYPGQENPDPLAHTGCAGFAAPTGLPLVVQLGSDPAAASSPQVSDVGLRDDTGADLEVCWFDAATYTNPDAATQARARQVLDTRDAVVIIPRHPLEAGHAYTARLTADGTPYTWTFRTAGPGPQIEPAPGSVAPGQELDLHLAAGQGASGRI
ncbi:MAG: CAP domain-containing protein, partial [Nitrospirae bacterium]